MRIAVSLYVVGAVVAASAVETSHDELLPNENPSDDMEIFTNDLKSPHDEIAEQPLSRAAGNITTHASCRTGRACRRREGTCMASSEICDGTVIDKGCGARCSCCVKGPGICERRQTCKAVNGYCMKNSGSCTGSIITEGCAGKDCVCCVNDNKCPNGFYRVGTECFKVYQKFAGWDEARHICRKHGWDLAEPEDPSALAEFMYTNVSHYYFWIGGRGVGGAFKYLSGESLQDNAPWGLGYPGDKASIGDCLILRSTNTSYKTTLSSFDCYSKYYFICEPACPKGLIRMGSDCYKVILQYQNWENAQQSCHGEGLQLAEPKDPKNLTKILYDGIGGTRYTSHHLWVGARGGRINGSTFAWNSGDPVPIPYPNNDTWRSGYPRYKTSSSYCLHLYTNYYRSGPMYDYSCTSSCYPLCELICPSGFFHIGNQCYKAYSRSASSWFEAREMCNQAHLTLAEPHDPIAVAHYLLTATGHNNYWLGGRGDGSRFHWSSGDALPNNWAPWRQGNPGNKVGRDYCLRLAPEHRNTPLISTSCSTQLYPLCQ